MDQAWFEHPSIGLEHPKESRDYVGKDSLRDIFELLPATVSFEVELQNICQQLGKEGRPIAVPVDELGKLAMTGSDVKAEFSGG